MTPLALVFGDQRADHARFDLDTSDEHNGRIDFVHGHCQLIAGDRVEAPDNSNGIEALALTHLRADLSDLGRHRSGAMYFTNHDTSLWINLAGQADRVLVTAEAPSLNLFNVELAPMTYDDVSTLVERVAEAERRFGALTGHCGCGIPPRTYRYA